MELKSNLLRRFKKRHNLFGFLAFCLLKFSLG